jgi:hypothetical protein
VNAKRLLAILAAAAMVAGAWFVRTKVLDKKSTSITDGSTPTQPATPGAALAFVCIPELEPLCRATGNPFTVEPAGTTLTTISTAINPNIVWVTLSPWPEMADAARKRSGLAPLPTDSRQNIGSSPVVIALPSDRVAPLKIACGDLAWKCIGEKVNRPWKEIGGQPAWQDVTFRHKDPLTSAEGLSALGASLAARVGRTDLSSADFSSNDIRSWTNQLESANKQPASDPLNAVVLGSRFDLVATLGALVSSTGRATSVTPTPVAQVGISIMATSGKLSSTTVSPFQNAAGKNGWTAGVTPTGLPDAVGMEAVQQLWRDVIR